MAASFLSLEVATVERLCQDAAAISFLVPDCLAPEFSYLPGQSLTVRRIVEGRDERRSYSICAPAGRPLRIGVREVPGGRVSGWLVNEVRPGDRIEVAPPTGSFTPDLESSGRHVLIAAGSGITPVLSIASSLLSRSPASEVALFYGNRRSSSVMFADELADLKDAWPSRVQLVHVLSREPQDVELFNGRLDGQKLHALLPLVGDPTEIAHWWLCGPYAMVADATALLDQLGIPAERVHRELFYVEELPPEQHHHAEVPVVANADLTFVLDGRATTTSVLPGDVILDAAQRTRSDVPFACKGGVCGSCRARLKKGDVRMRRNFALEPDELADGFVLTCQAIPVTDEVVVDFDA